MFGTCNLSDQEMAKGEEYIKAFHEKFAKKIQKKGTVFYAGQIEEGDDTKRTHIQFVVHFKRKKDFIEVNKQVWNRVNLRDQKGTNKQAIEYCCDATNKEKPTARYQIRYGEPIIEELQNKNLQGQRSDLAKAAKKAIDSGSVDTLWKESPGLMVQYGRGLREAVLWSMKQQVKDIRPIEFIVIFGPPGVGKSRLARTIRPGKYFVVPPAQKGQPKWFDGYEGEKTVIIEEFDDLRWPITYVNQLADEYHMQVPVKCGFVPALWTTIVFTCNSHPRTWWPEAHPDLKGGIMRRCKEIIEIERPQAAPEIKWPETKKRKAFQLEST